MIPARASTFSSTRSLGCGATEFRFAPALWAAAGCWSCIGDLCRKLDLGDCVALPGLVPSSWAFLERADVFCLPSRFEQSGALALLEAFQAGLAIVASACDGIPEDVRDGEDALLVTPGDPAALADALRRTLTDAGLRNRLSQGARETYERRFSADAFARELAALYVEFGMTP